MRSAIVLLTGVAILGLVNFSIYQKEQLLANGRVIYLDLAPVDPRSLMQGDYMALRFGIAQRVPVPYPVVTSAGYLIAALDARSVASFRRLDNGSPLAKDEVRIFYRIRGNEVRLGSNGFFFEEGTASYYQGIARYAEARLDEGGQMLLTALCDANLKRIEPPSPADAKLQKAQ